MCLECDNAEIDIDVNDINNFFAQNSSVPVMKSVSLSLQALGRPFPFGVFLKSRAESNASRLELIKFQCTFFLCSTFS